MKEAYCSYKVAKLLKEKGFDEECFGAYTETNHNITMFTGQIKNSEYGIAMYTAPTHQMACAWLREKGIEIDTYLSHITEEFGKKTKHYVFSIVDLNTDKDYPEYSEDYHYYPTYEEAVEAALKYSLENLI